MDLYNLVISAKLFKGEGGGGGDVDVESLSVTENGTYTAPSGKAYSPVTVSVPASGITPTGTKAISANGVYDVTDFASANVSVPVGVFPSGTKSIAENGIYDITNFSSVDVNVSGGGGGDHDVEDGIIQKTLSGTYENSRVSSIGSQTFYRCTMLESVAFPNVNVIATGAFTSCEHLSSVYLPKATKLEEQAFRGCTSLRAVSLPKAWFLGSSAFRGCSKLMSLYLLSESVVRCAHSTSYMFFDTPIIKSSYTGAFGSIFVPASLVGSYKTNSQWSFVSDRITAYEGE